MKVILALSLALFAVLSPAAIVGAHAQLAAVNSLQSLDYAFLSGNRTAVRLVFKHALAEPPEVFAIYHPGIRVVVDFDDMQSAVARKPLEVRQRDLLSLQVVRSGRHTRVIIRLLRPLVRETDITGHDLIMMLHRPQHG